MALEITPKLERFPTIRKVLWVDSQWVKASLAFSEISRSDAWRLFLDAR